MAGTNRPANNVPGAIQRGVDGPYDNVDRDDEMPSLRMPDNEGEIRVDGTVQDEGSSPGGGLEDGTTMGQTGIEIDSERATGEDRHAPIL